MSSSSSSFSKEPSACSNLDRNVLIPVSSQKATQHLLKGCEPTGFCVLPSHHAVVLRRWHDAQHVLQTCLLLLWIQHVANAAVLVQHWAPSKGRASPASLTLTLAQLCRRASWDQKAVHSSAEGAGEGREHAGAQDQAGGGNADHTHPRGSHAGQAAWASAIEPGSEPPLAAGSSSPDQDPEVCRRGACHTC